MQDIYWNLEESPYKLSLNNFKFIFSSRFYLNKFNNEFKSYILNEKMRLKNRYRINFICDDMLLIRLYKHIEKRGNRIFYKDKLLNDYQIELNISRIN